MIFTSCHSRENGNLHNKYFMDPPVKSSTVSLRPNRLEDDRLCRTNKKNGFTLLETLVVITIISVIAIFGVGVLSTVLNGGKKTATVSEIKQNGNYVMEIMARYIRNATTISSCSSNTLGLAQPDNSVVTFSLLPADASNNNRLASNSASLTNADRTNGVNVTSLTFTCDTVISPPLVTIDFVLSQGLSAGLGQENKASETFHTSVSLRTY